MSLPIAQLSQVVKQYVPVGGAPAQTALAGIDLQIAPSEIVAILGRSGSGKSTLLNLLAGLDSPTSGHIVFESQDLAGLSEDALARWRGRRVGIVFQFFQLLPTLTVLENVLLPMDFVGAIPRRDRRERALALLRRVGIADQAGKLPATLSGGQQQRAAIARALANAPALLIADEPTGNLDGATADGIVELFRELAGQNVAILLVTHDEKVAACAHRVIRLDDGRIASERRQRAAS